MAILPYEAEVEYFPSFPNLERHGRIDEIRFCHFRRHTLR